MNKSRREPEVFSSGERYRRRAKQWSGRVPVCVIYPNTYHLGMSNLGFQFLYHLFSEDNRFAVDRAFAPESIQEKLLLSYETGHKMDEFYILAFSISYENDYLNVLKILKDGGIPLNREDRGDKFPILIAGGAAITINPGAVLQVFDAVFIGEVEDAFSEFSDAIVENYEKNLSKEYLLRRLSEIDGFYVPGFYNYEFNREGRVTGVNPVLDVPGKVKRRITSDINNSVPRTFLFTSETEFSNMGVIEIARGCRWKCRFCAASYIYHPLRFRSQDVIKREILDMSQQCSKFGLLGALPTDHPELKDITDFIISLKKKFSFSSVRIGSLKDSIISALISGKENTVTLAPETGNERLRRVINKPITNHALFSQIERIVKNGLRRVKLYFLIGLPFERDEDVYDIAGLVKELLLLFPGVLFTLSAGIFVPKPHTPFQWAPFTDLEIIKRRIAILKKELAHKKNLILEISSLKSALIEAFLARSDIGVSKKLIELSGKLRGNNLLRMINYSEWIFREKDYNEFLPWDIIDNGIDRTYLLQEYKEAGVLL